MPLTFTPLHPHFGASVDGADLRHPTRELVDAVDAAMNRYAVLVFRGQPLTQDEQIDFTRAFGELDLGFKRVSNTHTRLKHRELADISNVAEDGELAGRTHYRIVNNVANQLWHSDSSFQNPPARYSMLHAVVVPPKGGTTEFADMRAAYDGLSDDLKQEIDGLLAEHFVLHSRVMLGDTGYSAEKAAALPRVLWPIVRTHDGSGRRHLFIGAHAAQVEGMTVPEGRLLLSDLLEHATQREFVYEHAWQPGDLVIWDNRCTLHRGRRYDFSQRRELRRSTTLDRAYPVEVRQAA
ncbi:TauD/TfdA family dioxygenase [Verticiella sediminum]|uniref:TauD/TfdA family dioxygenase n=1 Tax=Verticiella sediminum TaxID=1247510 RepID=A0A556AFC8_9BURK|nr:TauD/TfdA family dioxygenase [Verticiella sediminum]TSH91596.1 TauD/TfdA family dioxygenase [Verticiella sediminum]